MKPNISGTTIKSSGEISKFNANLKTDGKDILEIHRVAELDKKYEQKLKK